MARIMGLVGLVCLAMLAGCDGPADGPFAMPQSCLSCQLPGMAKGEVFEAAVDVLRSRGQVRSADALAGTIVCEPDYLARNAAVEAKQFRIISSPSDYRQVTSVTVFDEPQGARLDVCVAVQQRITDSVLAYEAMRAPGDVPNSTPVGTQGRDVEHREVWNTVARDHQAENDIVAAVRRQISPQTTAPPAAPASVTTPSNQD